jgi:hypothetical protein
MSGLEAHCERSEAILDASQTWASNVIASVAKQSALVEKDADLA